MKKFYTHLSIVAAILLTMTAMSSCDTDREEAYMLSGEWTGNFGMFYQDYHTGQVYWADYTDIRFLPAYDYATHGTGEEIDFFSWPCPVRYQSFFFRWEIRNGVIYLDYAYAHDLDVAIYDYRLSDSYFAGRFGDDIDSWFRLSKLSGFYGWNSYDPYSYYGYGYYDDYYYAKQRDGFSEQERPQLPDPKDFHFGRSLSRDIGAE